MKVILLKDLKGTGKKNDVVNVADGYAKNFLLPNKIATAVNAQNLNENNQLKQAQQYHKQVEIETATALKNKLQNVSIKLTLKQGENGRAFGSITSKEVADKLKEMGFDVDKKKLVMESIKTAGIYKVEAKLYTNISAKFEIVVESELV